MKMVMCFAVVLCVSCGSAPSKETKKDKVSTNASPGELDSMSEQTTQDNAASNTQPATQGGTDTSKTASNSTSPDPNKELDVKIGFAEVDIKTIQLVADQHAADKELQDRFTNLKTAFANLKTAKDEASRIKFCAAISPVLTYVGTNAAFSNQERDLVQSAVTSLREPENLCVPAVSR